MSDTTLPRLPGWSTGHTAVAVANEVHKGLVHAWAERRQIGLELAMFVPMFLLFAGLVGQGQAIVERQFDWRLDPGATAWLFLGFAAFMFFYLQAQKLFWRLVGEIQTGTFEQVHLSPLPTWVVAAAGRVTAAVVETAVVVGVLYLGVRVVVPIPLTWHAHALLALVALVVAGVGYSLAIGGLALVWKRTEVLNDGIHMVVLFLGGAMVPLAQLPGPLAAMGRTLPITHPVAALRTTLLDGHALAALGDGGLVWLGVAAIGWLALGAGVFGLGDHAARRSGTLSRY